MKSPTILAALLAVLAAAPARAQPAVAEVEHKLSATEIQDLAKRGLLWCDDWRDSSGDCNTLTLIRLSPDGKLVETTAMLISESPHLQAFIGDVDVIEGDRVCSKVNAAKTPMSFTIEGKPVASTATSGLRSILLSTLAELDGKTVCQSFYSGDDPMKLREEVFVDGERRQDLETVYLLRDPSEGFALRPQITKSDTKESKA